MLLVAAAAVAPDASPGTVKVYITHALVKGVQRLQAFFYEMRVCPCGMQQRTTLHGNLLVQTMNLNGGQAENSAVYFPHFIISAV
jgi:hypothetical protein